MEPRPIHYNSATKSSTDCLTNGRLMIGWYATTDTRRILIETRPKVYRNSSDRPVCQSTPPTTHKIPYAFTTNNTTSSTLSCHTIAKGKKSLPLFDTTQATTYNHDHTRNMDSEWGIVAVLRLHEEVLYVLFTLWRITSPTRGPTSPCKQSLSEQLNSWTDFFFLQALSAKERNFCEKFLFCA